MTPLRAGWLVLVAPLSLTARAGAQVEVHLTPEAVEQVDANVEGEAEADEPTQSAERAAEIFQACAEYAEANAKPFPTDMTPLVDNENFSPYNFLSPQDKSKGVPDEYSEWSSDQKAAWVKANISYVLLPNLTNDGDAKKIAVFERRHTPGLEKIPVVFNDNHVEVMTLDDADARIRAQTGRSLLDWSGLGTYEHGNQFYLDERYKDAIDAWEAALKREPSDAGAADASFLTARAWERLGKKAEASKAYDEFAKKYPGHASADLAKKRAAELRAELNK